MAFQGFPFPKQSQPQSGSSEGLSRPFTRPLVARNEPNISLTLDIPAEAAKLLTQLAEKNSYAFRQLGILTMQLQGEKPLTTSQVPSNCDESEDIKISKNDSTKAGLLKRPASSPLRPGFISPAAGCDSPERKRRKHEIPAPPGLQAGPFSSSVPSLSLTNGFLQSPSEGFSGNSLFSRLGSSPPDHKVKSRINLLARMNRMKPSETITRPNDLIAAALAKSTDVPKKKFSPNKSITEPGYVAEDSSSEGESEFELHNKSIKIANEIMKRGYKTVNRRTRDEEVDSATKIKLMLSNTSSSINRSPQSAKISPSGAESHTDSNHHGGDAKVKLVLSMREKKVKKISTGGKGKSDMESDDDEEFDSIKLKSIMKAKHPRSLADRIPALPPGINPCDKSKHLEFGGDPRSALDGHGSSGGPLPKSLTSDNRVGFWSRPNDSVNCNDEINLRLSDSLNRHSTSVPTTKCKSPTNPIENDNTPSESQLLVNDRLLGLNNDNESEKFLLEDRSDYKAVDEKSENSRNECSEGFNLPHRDTDSNVHQGDDSGIESMDTLSEKSPNQGETPSDDKIDREIKELEANSIIAGHSLKDANHLALLHNEPSSKSHTSDDGLDFHQSAPCMTVKGSTPDLVKKSDDSTIHQNNTSCKITEDNFVKEENTEHKSAATERPSILETDASFVDKSQAQTIESENCTSATPDSEPLTTPKESIAVDGVEKVSNSDSCASSPTKSPEELGFDDPSPVPEQEFVDSTQKEIQSSPMQSLLARAVKTQSAPSNTVHVNGNLSSGSLQLRPASMVPTGAKMVPVKVVSVSNDGAVRLLRVSPMKSTASNDPTVIPSRAVVIKSSMLRNAVSQQKDLAANPSLLQAQLAASKPISPSLLTNIKDTVKPPSLFNIINSATNSKIPNTTSATLVAQAPSNIANETSKTAELYPFPQDLKEKVVQMPVTPVSQSSSIIASVQMNSSSLSITPVVSQANSLTTHTQEMMETAVKAVKSKPRPDSSPLMTKADLPVGLRLPESTTLTKVEDKPKEESKIKGRSRPLKRTSSNNTDYGGSMLRPLLQKDETAEEVLTRSNARLKPGEPDTIVIEEPTKTTDLIETQHESQTAEKKEPESEHLVQNADSKLRLLKEEAKGLNSSPETQIEKVEAKLTPTRKASRSETNVEKQAPKIKASPPDAPSSASQVEDVKERRSVRQQNPAFVAKMQANRITKATVSRQKVNSDQAQENIDADWVAKPRRATASQAAGGSLNDKGSSSALNNSCSVVVEANKNMAGAKRIKTRSNKAADDQVETKRRRLKVESL